MFRQLTHRKLLPIYWLTLSCLIVAADYITGPYIRFPIFYVIPIALASWFNGRRWGFVLACSLPLVRILFRFLWNLPWGILETIVNAGTYMIIFSLLVFLIVDEAERHTLLKEVKVLRGLLPICSFCKRIRNRDNQWEALEDYITQRSKAEFSHGLCPECAKEHYGVFLPPEK